ncbi:hypothetical protein FRACYDRAFT_243099 [Fragilariopsis cylindrus CCMP1102]|uniref:PUB domain-containing protein n=1 Tax=Fragilariopsis cylindrus CCMP1102 TaxID=635003 RepID=A0A1E7F4S7_9STRA|nr:hypothetical protein FRACYDRAFT_243099 [Fragilariopsis cylindrus CCMP1102]|eukprot:OEU13188.1 hypothetical protein FRACYDRAFT_243099 [Fragilariopsis cylindrus CCMP1102]
MLAKMQCLCSGGKNKLKTLTVVLKNIIDPKKGGVAGEDGLKYRTLKLDNPKLKSRLFSSNEFYVLDLLTSSDLVGMTRMTQQENSNILIMNDVPTQSIQDSIGLRILPALTTTQIKIALEISTTANVSSSNKKTKFACTDHTSLNNTSSASSSMIPGEKLSLKQIARRELELKRQKEKQQDKLHRKNTKAQIAEDKKTRETDENWKPKVSAAADKSGAGIQTFRDRHGE